MDFQVNSKKPEALNENGNPTARWMIAIRFNTLPDRDDLLVASQLVRYAV